MKSRFTSGTLAAGLLLLGVSCDTPEGKAPASEITAPATGGVESGDDLAGRERVTVFYSANVWGELLECG